MNAVLFALCSKAAKSVRHKLPTAAVEALIQVRVRQADVSDALALLFCTL